MADENPLKLPPPVIGNPYIGDIGRGKLSDSPEPRRPAIPFVLWYGADGPVPPSTDTPPRPIVVTADGPITAPMVGYNIIKTMVSPPERQLVSPVIVAAQQSPNQSLFGLPFVFVERPPSQPPAIETPARPLVVKTLEAPASLPEVFTAAVRAVADTPVQLVTVRAVELPWTPPEILVAQTRITPAAPSTDTPTWPIVVAAVQPVQPQPFIYVSQTETPPPAAAPQVLIRPTVVGALEPPQPVDQVILYTVVSDWRPPDPTIVGAGPVPQALPFTDVISGRAEPAAPPPEVPIRPTVVGAQPVPPEYGRSIIDRGFAVAIPAAPPEVPIRPTIVNAQPWPQPIQPPQVLSQRTDPEQQPVITPAKPTIVNAQPLPTQYVQTPWVSYTEVDPPKVPVYPTVVGQQPIPPQAAFISTPKAGRWGNPPANHRIITPTVNVDMSLPFLPNGWVRVAHGFAEALPLLFEGTIVGGTLEGPLVSGGVMTGSAIGGTIQNGYVTGGVR